MWTVVGQCTIGNLVVERRRKEGEIEKVISKEIKMFIINHRLTFNNYCWD